MGVTPEQIMAVLESIRAEQVRAKVEEHQSEMRYAIWRAQQQSSQPPAGETQPEREGE